MSRTPHTPRTHRHRPLDLRRYARAAATTALYPERHRRAYVLLGLVGEAGECAELYKKLLRRGGRGDGRAFRAALRDELGDVLWYWAACCREFGLRPEDVARGNLKKLADRASAGQIKEHS